MPLAVVVRCIFTSVNSRNRSPSAHYASCEHKTNRRQTQPDPPMSSCCPPINLVINNIPTWLFYCTTVLCIGDVENLRILDTGPHYWTIYELLFKNVLYCPGLFMECMRNLWNDRFNHGQCQLFFFFKKTFIYYRYLCK